MTVDIRYADDTTLISTAFENLKIATKDLKMLGRNGASK